MSFDLFIPGARAILATVTAGLTGTIVYHYLTTKYFNNEDDNKVKKDSVLHLEVPKDVVAYFIGRNGDTIKKIELENNVTVSFIDSSYVNYKLTVIRGSKEGIEKAKEQFLGLAQEFSHLETAEVVVSQKIFELLTANECLKMREIATASKTRIYQYSLPNEKACTLLVRGSFFNIEHARKLLKSLAEDEIIEETRAIKALTPTVTPSPSSSYSSFKNSTTPSFEVLEATSFDGFCEVMISAIESPSKFFVQRKGQCSKDLDRLIEAMTEFYGTEKNKMRLSTTNVEVGSLVAAYINSDKNWYRAKITAVERGAEEALYHVSLLDFGDDIVVGNDSLAGLETDFLKLKFQAIECHLANVSPAGLDKHWSENAIELFDRLTYCAQWKIVMAKVKSFTQVEERQIYCVTLIDTNTEKDIDIAQELISHGFGI